MKTYDYLKQEYDKHTVKQEKIEQAIDKVLAENNIKDKQLFTNRIKNLMFIAENSNIDFVSIEFFRELFSDLDSSTIQQIYDNLIEVYSYLIKNNLLSFNSSFNEEIEEYITVSNIDSLDGTGINIARQMPSFIQKLLYKNVMLEQQFEISPDFAKQVKYKTNKTNALLNIVAEDITDIIAEIYPDINKEIVSAQLFFTSLSRLTYGTNYNNNKISISNKLIERFKNEPEILINIILESISHELGHEELVLRGILPNRSMVRSLHELYAYLFEILFTKSYSKLKGINEGNFKTLPQKNFIKDTIDSILMKKEEIINFILGKQDEHEQALNLLAVINNKQYQNLFTKERIMEILDFIETFSSGISFEDDNITKVIRVDDLNIQAISFFILMLMFGNIDISFPKILALSKSLTVFNTDLFDSNKVLGALARNDTDYMYRLIDEIIVKGTARIKELNELLFGNKTFDFNGKTYGYSITTNRSENGLLKDDKILIYFTPNEIKFLVNNMDPKKAKSIKRKANLLTKIIAKNPIPFLLQKQVNIVKNTDKRILTIRQLITAPIKRGLNISNFILDGLKISARLPTSSSFKNIKAMNVIYYDDYNIITPRKDILSVYVTDTEFELDKTSFELTEYTINGRSLRLSYDIKNNLIIAYCPQASKQEIIEMTAKYIKSDLMQQSKTVNLKNIVIDSDILPNTITYHLSQDNEGFECISINFMELGLSFIEALLKVDDIESVMFSKQIYDYVGDISFKQLS
ncbi:MAG: hypothetical protein K5622_06670, partial [Endomicrobiaceae bacterium]|nr:hypothetical protein [Endomicrobiaceae bacterium]